MESSINNNTTESKLKVGNLILLTFLYCIPIIGWVFAFIHAKDKSNERRMKYAKSFSYLILSFIVSCITVGLFGIAIFFIAAKIAEGLVDF
ncbi:MAG: hypothetical protein E7338_00465 [Clostridiales bacterium]|nr:hypothetical protein [Clostridiales bacterium]